MRPSSPAELDLVLVGGGHAHALVLRKLVMERPPSLRVTLISPSPFTPYSGMLPGLLAGHYSFEEAHIDLARLCQWARVRFLPDTVEALDPTRRHLRCRTRGELGYDLLSIDIGSQPELDSVPGARDHAIPVKPVAGLWERWQSGLEDGALADGPLAIVGGGAGSVEIALAVAHRLRDNRPPMGLYCGAERILPGYSGGVQRAVEQKLAASGVDLHCGRRVTGVTDGQLAFGDDREAAFQSLIWCTGAAAAPWIAASGVPVDERGFMAVNDCLQSTDFDEIFGCGDIATQVNHPRPKAGVYAVRQAPVLAHNLIAGTQGAALKEHHPQRRFLSLLSLGDRHAVAERNGFSIRGDWVWRWKDRIDRKFMDQFVELPTRPGAMAAAESPLTQMPCGGCGAKVTADVLTGVMDELRAQFPAAAPTPSDLDDAAQINVEGPLLQSIDALRALVDDPWRMGRIAAQHALSDLYASGATPHSAQALVVLPFAEAALLRRDLRQVLAGALSIFATVGCRLVGGHSMQGPEFQIGFAVNGVLQGRSAVAKRGALEGDKLILTGALGVGALFAAHMQARADGRHIDAALATMERGNAVASRLALEYGARAMTDVTGFGLAGHLMEMLDDGGTGARLDLDALAAVDGGLAAMRSNIFSTLHAGNRDAVIDHIVLSDDLRGARAPKSEAEPCLAMELLFDPQTCGGLLMAVPPRQLDGALAALREQGVAAAAVGELLRSERGAGTIQLTRNSRIRSL